MSDAKETAPQASTEEDAQRGDAVAAEVEATVQSVAKLPRARAAWIARGAFLVAFLSAPAIAMRVPAVQEHIIGLAHGLRDGGLRGIAIYWAVCALSGVFAAPLVIFAGLAGFAFGPAGGVAVALPGLALHTSAAFLVGRMFLRTRVERQLAGSARWAGIDGALRAEGFRIAVLLRLTPLVPQNLLSYALSASALSFPRFALASLLGLAPIIVVQATLGSLAQDAAELLAGEQDPTRGVLMLLASAVVTLLALYGVTRVASRSLGRAMARHAPSDGKS